MRLFSILLGSSFLLFLGIENAHRFKFYRSNYDVFIDKVKAYVPKGSTVFASDELWLGLKDDYNYISHHNISHWKYTPMMAKESPELTKGIGNYYNCTYDEFLLRQHIQYIVADRELIAWPYQQETLIPFLEKHCTLVGTFEDDFYNFSDYMAKRSPVPLVTKIYKVTK